MLCSIIPDDILDKIEDRKSLELTAKIRAHREFLLKLKREGRIPIPQAHDEVRVLFDGKHNDNLDDSDANIIQIDFQHHSTEPSTNAELELFNRTYDFFHDVLGKESFDDRNTAWKIFKFVGEKYNNAFWNGEVFAFGDGDQEIFKTFMIQNIATHEAMHAVTEHIAGLVYQGMSGALNEHISDVFAICVDQKLGSKSWVIGEGLFMPSIQGEGLRTFENRPAYDDPIIGVDIQPKHMRGFYKGTADHGGVHINSGIPNHAFYAFCKRSGEVPYERPMHIWWDALTITKQFDDFWMFADKTVQVCPSDLREHLIQAWQDVGIQTKEQPKINFINIVWESFKAFFLWFNDLIGWFIPKGMR